MPKKVTESKKQVLDPLIGLELTFSNEITKKDIGEQGVSVLEARKRYEGFIESSQKAFESSYKKIEEYFFDVKASIVEPTKKLANDEKISDLRVEFSDQGELKFWLNITRDPQVIEIQTMPVKASEYSSEDSIPSVILTKLFEDFAAGKLIYGDTKLSPSKEGGGHINVDAKTSGLLDKEAILLLIELWDKKTKDYEGLIEAESQTAALLSDRRYLRTKDKFTDEAKDRSPDLMESLTKAFAKFIDDPKAQKKTKDSEEIEQIDVLKKIMEAYWKYPQVKLFNKLITDYSTKMDNDDELRICTHNQAINVEHLFTTKDERAYRRIEFRDFVAQGSVADIAKCWSIIEEQLFKIPHIQNNFAKFGKFNSEEAAKSESKTPKSFLDKIQSQRQDKSQNQSGKGR